MSVLLSGVMPVPAILDGRGFLGPVERRKMTPDVVVDVDMALPGRDEPPGVTSPERDPIYQINTFTMMNYKWLATLSPFKENLGYSNCFY